MLSVLLCKFHKKVFISVLFYPLSSLLLYYLVTLFFFFFFAFHLPNFLIFTLFIFTFHIPLISISPYFHVLSLKQHFSSSSSFTKDSSLCLPYSLTICPCHYLFSPILVPLFNCLNCTPYLSRRFTLFSFPFILPFFFSPTRWYYSTIPFQCWWIMLLMLLRFSSKTFHRVFVVC